MTSEIQAFSEQMNCNEDFKEDCFEGVGTNVHFYLLMFISFVCFLAFLGQGKLDWLY